MSTSISVTCVIVSFHRPESLAQLLGALDDPRIETVVVNVEDDPAVNDVATGRAITVGVGDNVGYAAAVNAGVLHATQPVLVYMNDDVLVTADAVLRLAERVDGGTDVAVPMVVDRWGRAERTIFPLLSATTLLREWVFAPDNPPSWWPLQEGHERWRLPRVPERIQAASAVVVATRTELIRRIRMPEEYFLYWEEIDWFFRLAKLQAVVVYDPSIQVQHWGGRAVVQPEKCELLARNAIRCVHNTRGRVGAAGAWPASILWNIRLLLTSAIAGAGRSDVHARLAGLKASLAGWREI